MVSRAKLKGRALQAENFSPKFTEKNLVTVRYDGVWYTMEADYLLNNVVATVTTVKGCFRPIK